MTQLATPTAKAPRRMNVSAVNRPAEKKPFRILLHGMDGVGKTTFASEMPSPVFVGVEDGTDQIGDAKSFPKPESWTDLLDAVDSLTYDIHDYETLVIDTLDWAEPLCWDHVCKAAGKTDIEAFGYGKGYVAAFEQWRILIAKLETLREKRKMHIVLLAHPRLTLIPSTDGGEDYQAWDVKLHKTAAAFVREWADAVLFAYYEVYSVKGTKRANGGEARVMATQFSASSFAKNRFGLPPTLPFSWSSFLDCVSGTKPANEKKVRARIAELIAKLDEETRDAATESARDAKDARELARILNKLEAIVGIENAGKEETK